MAQSTDWRADGDVTGDLKTLPKLIRQEYRLPADAPREKAICVYALAPYEPGRDHDINEYVGSIPQPGSDPKNFTVSSLEEAAQEISKIAEMDVATVLDVFQKGPLFEAHCHS